MQVGQLKTWMKDILNGERLKDLSSDQRRKITLVNKISSILIVCAIPYIFIFRKVANAILGNMVVPIVATLCVSIFLNQLGYRKIAGWILILCSNLTILFYSTSLSKDAGIQLVYFALVLLPFVIFNAKEKFSKSITASIPIMFMTYSELFQYNVFFRVPMQNSAYLYPVYLTIIFVTFSILVLSINFYTRSLDEKADKLVEAQDEIKIKQKQDMELEISGKLFRNFVNTNAPSIEGYDAGVIYLPSNRVGGDFIDWKSFGKNELTVVTADVKGHGLEACFPVIHLHSMFHTHCKDSLSPKEIAYLFNNETVRIGKNNAICGMIAKFDLKNHLYTYSHAGLGVCFHFSEGELTRLDIGGMVFGACRDGEYEEETRLIKPGDFILIASDGIAEYMVPGDSGKKKFKNKFMYDELEDYLKQYDAFKHENFKTYVSNWVHQIESENKMSDDVVVFALERPIEV